MANGNGGSIFTLFKLLFGEVPGQWVRMMVLGGMIVYAAFALRDFRNEVKSEGRAVRSALSEYVASNRAWQDASMSERRRLIAKADARFARLYKRNGWEYEEMER